MSLRQRLDELVVIFVVGRGRQGGAGNVEVEYGTRDKAEDVEPKQEGKEGEIGLEIYVSKLISIKSLVAQGSC